MRLTPEQLAEGRLLAKVCDDPTNWPPENADMIDYLWEHRKALLAEPIDVEEIKRAAVREFAEELHEKRRYVGNGTYLLYWEDISSCAKDSGVNLDEKP